MKVCLINPAADTARSLGRFSNMMAPIPPPGPSYLAAVLEKKNIDVCIEDQFASKRTNRDIAEDILKKHPDIVGFSCLTPAFNTVIEIISFLHSYSFSGKIILGNVHSSYFHRELLANRTADYIIHGEGEETISELIDSVFNSSGKNLKDIPGLSFLEDNKVIFTGFRPQISDLDKIPYPSWHLLDFKNYPGEPILARNNFILPVTGSRGCNHNCFYCAQNYLQKKVVSRNIIKVVDEIEYFYSRFGVNFYGFTDPMFPNAKDQGTDFCNEMIKRGLHKKIKWFTENRVDFLEPDLLCLMKESGCHMIQFGFEVGDPLILNSISKNTYLEQAKKVIKMTKKAKILSYGLFMIGLPGETKSTIERTFEFSRTIDCDFAKFNRAVPYPGTKFYEMFKDSIQKYIKTPEKFTAWYEPVDEYDELPYLPEGISASEIINLQKKGLRDFYLRPKMIIRHILNKNLSPKTLILGASLLKKFSLS